MKLPFATFIMDRVRRVTEISLETGKVNWTARGVGDPSLELNGETVDKQDAYGALIAQIDTAKGASLSANLDTTNIPLLASQRGAKVEVGSEAAPVSGRIFDVVNVKDGKATLTFTPKVAPAFVYPIKADQTQGEEIEVGTEAGNAQITGNTVTLPADFAYTMIGLVYDYETADAIRLSDSSEEFGSAAEYIVEMYMRDICTDTKRLGYLVFPKGKLDNNVTLDLTTEGTHPFTITAQKEYCADESQLYYWIWATK